MGPKWRMLPTGDMSSEAGPAPTNMHLCLSRSPGPEDN